MTNLDDLAPAPPIDLHKITELKAKAEAKSARINARIRGWFSQIFATLGRYVRRLFMCPLVKDPIYFDCGDTAIAKLLAMGNLYDSATQELIESVFEERKHKIKGREPAAVDKIDLDYFKGWTQDEIRHLKRQFRNVEDQEHKGSVDFKGLCKVLDKIGNKKSEKDRLMHFNAVDRDRSGLVNFEEYCTLIYHLENTDKGLPAEAVTELYRNLNREANMIKQLNVVQQLQSGLF